MPVQYEKRDHIGVVTLSRPQARNAWGPDFNEGLARHFAAMEDDDDIRVAILTGAGGDFCSGMDLKAFASGWEDSDWQKRFAEDSDLHWRALLRHRRLTKPLIAAVEGYAVAGGTEILQATDIRVAGESAVFGVTEVTRGLFPLGGSTVRLRRQIPHTKAMEILLTGDHYSATEAERMGLIGRVVPTGQAVSAAREIAGRIAANGPIAVRAVKQSVMDSEWLPEAEALARELEIGWPVFATEDAQEGPRAFAEKRTPNFKGK
jgi:enoyl-CoA hydratase/carnithine racemase